MASLNNANPEDDQKQPAGAPVSTGGAGGAASGGQSAGVGGAAPASPVAQNDAPQANAGYTDVATYLDANKGGSAQLGQQVANNLTHDYNTLKSGIDSSSSGAQNMADQGYTHENAGLIQQAASNPVGTSADPNNVNAFQAQLNDKYTGPTSWGDYGTLQGSVAQGQQGADLYKTPGGLNVLTQRVEGPGASQGINQLDTMLLGGSPDAMSAVKSAADPYSTLTSYLDSQNKAVTGAITTGQNNAAQTSADALNAFTGANGTLTNLNNTINTNTSAALSGAEAQNKTIRDALSQLQVRGLGDVAGTLGLTPEQSSALTQAVNSGNAGGYATAHNAGAVYNGLGYGDLTGYLQQQDPASGINAGNVATADQYQQMAAIQRLLGDQTPANNAIDPATAAQAGTAPTNFNTFNYEQALNDMLNGTAANKQAAQDQANTTANQQDAEHAASKQHGFGGLMRRAVPNVVKGFANPLAIVPQEIKEAKQLTGK